MVSRVNILLEKTSNSDSGGLSLSATATSTEAKTVWILHFRADSQFQRKHIILLNCLLCKQLWHLTRTLYVIFEGNTDNKQLLETNTDHAYIILTHRKQNPASKKITCRNPKPIWVQLITSDRGGTYVAIVYPAHHKFQFSLAFALCAGGRKADFMYH